VTIDNFVAVSYTEFEDQQTHNVTLDSVEQKDTVWSVDGNLPVSSFYEFLRQDFNETNLNLLLPFSDSTEDNETSGSKSNEILTDNEDEDGLSRSTPLTFTFFTNYSSQRSNGYEDDKSSASNFASTSASNEESSENEAIHGRSKENFVASSLWIKDNKDEIRNHNETNSRSFSVLVSDESIGDHGAENPVDYLDSRNKNMTNIQLSVELDPKAKNTTEELLFQNIKIVLNNRTNVSNFLNDTNNVETRFFTNSENEDSEKLLIKSYRDFFSTFSIKKLKDKVEALIAKFHDASEVSTYETANETDNFINIPLNEIQEMENYLNDSNEIDEITSPDPSTSYSNKVLLEDTVISNETFATNWLNSEEFLTDNSTFTELITNELLNVTNPSTMAFDQSFEDSYKFETMGDEVPTLKNDSLYIDKVIGLMSTSKPPLEDASLAESNLTNKNEDNPSTLTQLISRSFSSGILATATIYSNEITTMLDAMSLPVNRTEDQSAKYPNILATTLSSLPENRTDQDKAAGKARIPESGFDEDWLNRTAKQSDDLFSNVTSSRPPKDDWISATTVQLPEDDWSSVTTTISMECTSEEEGKL
jgi:hypothetical protein